MPANPPAPAGFDGDVLIQAGHQNTPDNKTGGEGPLGNEIDWTPIVADEATRILRSAGVSTIREDASLKRPERQNERFRVRSQRSCISTILMAAKPAPPSVTKA